MEINGGLEQHTMFASEHGAACGGPATCGDHDRRAADNRANTSGQEAPATQSLLSLPEDCISRCIAWTPDPSAAAASCKAFCGAVQARDFAINWFMSGGALAGGSIGTRAITWRKMQGRGAADVVKWLVACRRRQRRDARGRPAGEPCGSARGESAAEAEQEEQRQEEEDALLLIERGHEGAALMLLAGPYAQHLLLPLAARSGNLPLVKELLACRDLPLRPMLLEGDPEAGHYILVTAARAAMRAGSVEVAGWVVERLLADAQETDVDRGDAACHADPFGLLRFCCRHGAPACMRRLPGLAAAARAAVAADAPAPLLRSLATSAAARVDPAGVGVAEALVDLLPKSKRAGAVWFMLPFGCRSGYAPMQALMVRLAEAHSLMPCVPGQMVQSTAAMREVLASALDCQPPIGPDSLAQFIHAALQAVLSQPLVDAGLGDSVETAEELWGAARSRNLQAAVMARLKLPHSVPARVWLERRRLEGEKEAAAAGAPGAARDRGAADAPAAGRSSEPALATKQRLQWLSMLRLAGGGGDAAAGDRAPRDPPVTHLLECLEGAHGAAALDAAEVMLSNAAGQFGGCRGGGGGGDGGGATWLTLRSHDALPGGDQATEAAALGRAVICVAGGDVGAVERLAALGRKAGQQRQARDQHWWQPRRWWRQQHNGDAAPAGAAAAAAGAAQQQRRRQGGGATEGPLPSFPEPGDVGYDKLLVAAAKHGRERVLRLLLAPLLAASGGGSAVAEDAIEMHSRGALLMGVALRRRQRGLVRLLLRHGLGAGAAEGYRLLQTPPPARPPRRTVGQDTLAPANDCRGDLMADQRSRAAARDGGADGAAACGPCHSPGYDDEEDNDDLIDDDAAVAADAELAVALLRAAPPGGRNERLLGSWLLAAGSPDAHGVRLCGRRCVAVLRAAAGAPGPLPVGARVAAPRALLMRGVLPAADLDVLEAAFEWLERVRLVSE